MPRWYDRFVRGGPRARGTHSGVKLLKRPGIGVPMFGVMLAAVLVPLNSTMIAVALPEVADDLDVSTGTSGVLIVVYLVVMLVVQPLSGRVGDAVGARRVLVVGQVGVVATSLAAALAGSFAALVAARTAQAVFAAMLVPSVQSIMRRATTRANRGRLFGVFGSLLGVGAAAGPLVGGVLTSLAGWPAVFLVNLPVVGAALAMQRRPVEAAVAAAEPVEGPGRPRSGSVINRVFGGSFLAQGATTFGQYTLILVVPLVLDQRGWGADEIGLAVTALTAGTVVVGPVGGRLGDERGRRAPGVAGLLVAAGSLWALAGLGGDVAAPALIGLLGAFGVGFGLAAPNLMTAAIESVPPLRSGAASGLFATARYSGSIPASLAFATISGSDVGGADGLLVAAAAVALVGLPAAWLLPDGRGRTDL